MLEPHYLQLQVVRMPTCRLLILVVLANILVRESCARREWRAGRCDAIIAG
jgi:hypothetical protein